LIVVLAGIAGACDGSLTDTSGQDAVAEASDADPSVVPGDFTEGLGLTDAQIEAVREVLEEYRGRGREPGTLWYAAADLQGIFTADQIAAIEGKRAEMRSEVNSRRGHMRGQKGERSADRRGLGSRRGYGPGGDVAGLDLSDEQVVRLKEIRESYAPQMSEIRDGLRDGSLTREDAAVRLEAIRDAIHEATQSVLTPDQVALLETHRAEAESRREGARSQREERIQAERTAMIAALGLTSEQVAAIDALRESRDGEDRPSRDEMEAQRDARHQAVLAILDDDQEQIWILHRSLSAFVSRQAHTGSGAGFGSEGRRGPMSGT
jgi:hypothetical protein